MRKTQYAQLVLILVLLSMQVVWGEIKTKEGTMKTNTMASMLAGSWYPANAEKLNSLLKQCFECAEVTPRSDVIALISPHAGFAYSGNCAAKGMKLAQGQYKRIFVIGPSHRLLLNNRFAIPDASTIETPLGDILIDTETIQKLAEYSLFKSVPQAFQGENSIEMQLPLLKHHYSDFKLIPIAAGQCDLKTIQEAGAILQTLVDQDTLVVASGDFTHYGPNFQYLPFTEDVPENLEKLDMGAWAFIERLDAEGFLNYQQETGATICGRTSIAVLLSMLDPKTKTELVDYRTSGEMTGDYQNSVSYVSGAFLGQWPQAKAVPSANAQDLSEADKTILLSLARKTIDYALQHGRVPTPEDLGIEIPESAHAERAAFVTLHQGPELRGCIGEIFPSQMLYQSIIKNAINASLHDPRFSAVSAAELPGLHLEISALTPPSPVSSWQEIRIGIDGMVLKKQGRSAIFLPQVAPEQGWDIETTLTYLARKAGLSPDAWREGAEYLTFQADVFGEPK